MGPLDHPTEFASAIISILLCLIFALILLYDIRKQRYAGGDSSQTKTHIVILIYADLFMIMICLISAVLVLIFPSHQIMCTLVAKIWFLSFHINRCLLYLVSIQRMVIMYHDTIIPFNINLHRYIVYIFITIYAILYLIPPLLASYIADFNLLSMDCLFQFEPLIFRPFAFQHTSSIFHIFMIVYLVHLFINPLRKLVQIQAESSNKQVTLRLNLIMVKYIILHSFSVISAIIFIIFCIFYTFSYNFTVIDAFVNGVMLVLLNSIHNRLYKNVCCLLHYFCLRCICKTEQDAWNRREAEPTEDDIGKGAVFGTGKDNEVELVSTESAAQGARNEGILTLESYKKLFADAPAIKEDEFKDKQDKTLQFLDALSYDL